MNQRNFRPNGADGQLGEVRRGFAPHFRAIEVFYKYSARRVAPYRWQSQNAPKEVVVLDTADESAPVAEGIRDGAIHSHALVTAVQGRGGERPFKAPRRHVEAAGVGLHQPDAAPEVLTWASRDNSISRRGDTGRQSPSQLVQSANGKVNRQDPRSQLHHQHREAAVATADFEDRTVLQRL